MNELMAVDSSIQTMVLEEQYATLRVEVRDIYQESSIKLCTKQMNIHEIAKLRQKIRFYNKKKIQHEIDLLEKENNDIDVSLQDLSDRLTPLSEEMEEIESKIGDRLKMLYGKDFHWWVR